MSSSNYQILWDSVDSGGSDTSSSTSYILRDSVSNPASGSSSSTNFTDQAGYRSGIFDQFITFKLFGQNNSSEISATGLSGETITANNTSFSVNDYVALVQDRGAGQITAIGKITSLGSGTIIVDDLKDGGVVPTIDGSNDYVYKLSGSSLDFGNFSTSSVSTSILGLEITIDSDSGYTIQTMSDGELRSGINSIPSVADGTVTAGSAEYGAISSDTTLTNSTFDTQDTAFTTSFQDIANESTFQFISRNFLTLKTAIDVAIPAGTYGQVLTFIASANF